VKWVKDSYGFIQSPFHTEDLFYHASEHCNEAGVTVPLSSGQEVEFVIVKNALTGKLNATQIHLLARPDPRLAELRTSILKENLPRNQGQPGQQSTIPIMFPQPMTQSGTLGTKAPFRAAPFIASGTLKSQHANGAGAILETESNREPGLHKTKLCKFFPYCPRGVHCWFAHGAHELRMHVEGPIAGSSVFDNVPPHSAGGEFQQQSFGSSALFHIGGDHPINAPVSSWTGMQSMSQFPASGGVSSVPYQQGFSSNHHVPAYHPAGGAKAAAFGFVPPDTPQPLLGTAGWNTE
jgi:cold shock CspA family protein